jgi:hypothetical protein
LGTHTFHALTPPDAVVAQVDADGVGWVQAKQGASFGPWSFDITNGIVWLLDEVNVRLLGLRAGLPDLVVPLPAGVVDFASAPDGTFYVTTHPPGEPVRLAALARDGGVLWRAPLAAQVSNNNLRFGPDGVLYDREAGDSATWYPVVGADGVPLSVAEQNRLARRYQPLPGGNRLIISYVSDHETRVAVQDGTGQLIREWRITSDNDIALDFATPALVGGDPVVTLGVLDESRPPGDRLEQIVLRLNADGVRVALHVDNAHFGDQLITEYRVGSDGALYQLQTSRATGVKIARFGLGVPAPAPTPTESQSVPTPTGHTAIPTPSAGPGVAGPTAMARSTELASWWWLIWTSGILFAAAIAGGSVLLWRKRRRLRTEDAHKDESVLRSP